MGSGAQQRELGIRCALGRQEAWGVGKITPGLCGKSRVLRADSEVLFKGLRAI